MSPGVVPLVDFEVDADVAAIEALPERPDANATSGAESSIGVFLSQ